MANETRTNEVTEYINSEWIRPVINLAAKGRAVAAQFALQLDLRGKGTSTAAIGQEVSDAAEGSLGSFDLTEATDMSNTAFETTEQTVSTGEYGIKRTITDTAVEDNILGESGLMGFIVESGARDMAICIDDDVCALLGSFSTTVGTTTVDLTLANMAQAVASLRGNEMPAPDGAVFILGNQQGSDYDAALVAAQGTQLANYHTKPESANGLDGYLGTWMMNPIHITSLVDTANTGADEAGALFIRGDGGKNPQSAAIAVATSREIRIGYERDESLRATEVIITQRKGAVEAIDLAGVSVITDA